MRARELQPLADQVAKWLPGEWTTDKVGPDDWVVRVSHADGRIIAIASVNAYGKGAQRLDVHGVYPMDCGRHMTPRDWGVAPWDRATPTITVSAEREPEKIAADIVRRFLAPYSALLYACLAAKTKRQAEYAQTNAALDQVEAAYPTVTFKRDEPARTVGFTRHSGADGEAPALEITVGFRGDYVEIKASLTLAEALALAPQLTARRPAEDDGTSGQDRESYTDTQDRKSYAAGTGAGA